MRRWPGDSVPYSRSGTLLPDQPRRKPLWVRPHRGRAATVCLDLSAKDFIVPTLSWLGDSAARKVPNRILESVETIGDPSSDNPLIQGDDPDVEIRQ